MTFLNTFRVWGSRMALGLLLLLAVLSGLIHAQDAKAPANRNDELRTMVVQVADDRGMPLEKARVHVSVWPFKDYKGPKIPNKDYMTDAKGNASIKVPRRLMILRLWASKAGHVARFVNFDYGGDLDNDPQVPETFRFRLEKGAEVGGTIKDEKGQPIAGVKVAVSVNVEEPEWGSDPKPIISTWLTDDDFSSGPVLTDETGRWRIDNAPVPKKPDDYRFRLMFTHKDYASDVEWGGLQARHKLTTAQLRAGTANLIMSRGVIVKGNVVDKDGRPVDKGLVIWDKDPYGKTTVVEAAIDKAGRFETLRLLPGEYPFTIVAPGFGPKRELVSVKDAMEDVRFTLGEGKRLAIRFIDTAGVPVPKVSVGIAHWREEQALYNHHHPYYVPDSGIPRQADENGLYVWDWAPEDEVGYYFDADGFKGSSENLSATKDDHIITLEPE